MPNDAYITCLRPGGYPIPDLKLKLRRGESVWVSAGRAATSTDLTTAIKTGAVSCVWVDPNAPKNSVQNVRTASTPPVAPTPPIVSNPPVSDVEGEPPCVGMLRTLLQQELQIAVAQIQQQSESMYRLPQIQHPYIVLDHVPVAVTTTAGVTADPVYIPSTIMPTGAGISGITIAAQQTDAAGMDEAAAALRASRANKPRTRKNTTTDSEE